MKAIVYTKYGSPDVLQVKEVEKPTFKDDEVLIKVLAAEVTKANCEMRSFKFQVKWFWLPLRVALGLIKPKKQVLGGYFAGQVESVGKDVSKFKEEDQVLGTIRLRLGARGEYVCLPASYPLVTKPYNVSFEEAAAVHLGGLNALHFLRKASSYSQCIKALNPNGRYVMANPRVSDMLRSVMTSKFTDKDV
jgi:NADPH:quinone reductase-like Zn-dependent oxidoreductase